MESKVLPEPILVGRERELEELHRELQTAIEGKGRTVFISAEAGIGKTRLVTEFLNSIKKENITKLSGWCFFNAGVPYFPFIEAFSSYYSTLTGKSEKEELELNSWLNGPSKAELSGKLEHFSPRALKDQTFVAVSKTIQSIATRNPVILFIEDIHWADSASLALIHYIARAINNSERVLILATYRSEELTIDSQGYPHQLIETLCMMRREDLFNEIKLAKLNQASVIEMAESMLGGCLDKDLAEKLATKSEGNPLFVVETLRMLHEKRIFAQLNNKWGIAVNELNIPSKIKDIITKRLACLNSAQRRILDAASVIGEEFDVGLLSALIEQDSLDVLETLNVIAYSTSLIIADENQYKFDHARSREIIYETLAQPLRRGYHGRIGEIFERLQSGVLPLGDLAYHYARAGNREKVAKYALAAGKDALAKWSNAQAIEHFQTALQNIAANKDDRRTALEGLGDAYAANYMYAEAIKTFDKLASCSTDLVKLRAFRKATDAAYAKGDMPDLLFEYAEKAEKIASSNRLEMARVFNNRARAFAWAGRGNTGLDLADYDSALQVFEEENSLADMAEALSRSGELNAASEDLSEKSLSALLRSVAIFRDLGDSRKEIEARMRLGFAFGRGLFSEARCELANILRDGDKSGAFIELARAHGMLSLIDESEGELSRALSHILKAFEYCKKTNVGYVQALDLAALTRLYCKLGDSRIADEYFEKLIELPPEATSSPLVGAMTLLSKGVYFAFKGKWEESNQAFAKYEKLGWKGFDDCYSWSLEKQGRFEEAKIQRDKIKKTLAQVEERFRHANIQIYFLVPKEISVGQEFEVRLDLVNVAKNPGTLIKVEGLHPSGSKVVSIPSYYSIDDGSIKLNLKRIGPFQVETIQLKVIFAKAGTYAFDPCLFYVNELGEARTSKGKSVTINAHLSVSEAKLEGVAKSVALKLEFKSEAAEKAFNFLVSAFMEDSVGKRLPPERSGWRTLTEVAKKAQIPMYSLYGRYGKGGEALQELMRLGIVESRFLTGERGRGGRVLKLRIFYERKM